jgi:polar amino acid transport system substrate-binding protein
MRTAVCILFCLSLMLVPVRDVRADDAAQLRLLVCYLEFPPYYYTNNAGQPDGFLLGKADAILRGAGISPVYESMPAKRILRALRTNDPVCSIGWFMTEERRSFAKFSHEIYRNKPLEVLYLKENAARFQSRDTLEQLTTDKSLIFGLLEGYSLGPAVDDIIAQGKPSVHRVNGDYPQLVRMLAMNRFTCILVAPEEIESLVMKNRLPRDIFAAKTMSDIPSGNSRHLMFSQGVPDRVIARINAAIDAMDRDD